MTRTRAGARTHVAPLLRPNTRRLRCYRFGRMDGGRVRTALMPRRHSDSILWVRFRLILYEHSSVLVRGLLSRVSNLSARTSQT